MKFDTIKEAIANWNKSNDYSEEANTLLDQGIMFMIDKNVAKVSPTFQKSKKPKFIHAYIGVLENSVRLFLINDVMDSPVAFSDTSMITEYIFIADLRELSSSQLQSLMSSESSAFKKNKKAINVDNGHRRILNWSLSKNNWIQDQIRNIYGLFQAFSIPIYDIVESSEACYGFLALKQNMNAESDESNLYVADLIIWDEYQSTLYFSDKSNALEDTVTVVPPFGNSNNSESDFYLMNAE